MLHGGGQSRGSWRRTAARLADAGVRSVAVDLRGHGDSDWSPGGDYTLPTLGDDVAAVAERTGGPVVLVGASLGGQAAAAAAARHPGDWCRAVVLVDIAPSYATAGRERVLAFMRAGVVGFASLEAAAAHLDAGAPRPPGRATGPDAVRRLVRRCDDGRYRWRWDPALLDDGRTGREQEEAALFAELARALRPPVLLLRGEHSDIVTPAHAATFVAGLADGEWRTVPGAAHMVVGESNEAFTAEVLAFLDRRGLVGPPAGEERAS
nr:alpha/beta fold hydrolase [Nocardioides zeae]